MSSQAASIERTNDKCWYKEVCQLENTCKMCRRYGEMSYLMENSNLPKAKQRIIKLNCPKCDEEAYQKLSEIKSDMYDFVADGRNLYIGSEYTGNGKTSWAIKLMHQYFDEIWDGNGYEPRALFIHVPTFIMKFKNFKTVDAEFESLKKRLFDIELVVWDDIAGLDFSAYDFSVLLSYIDYRSLAELSNIYTANAIDRESLSASVGVKLTSRIMSSNTDIVIFKNGDMR